jgi:ribonuclease P/MRP protein subunit POP1
MTFEGYLFAYVKKPVQRYVRRLTASAVGIRGGLKADCQMDPPRMKSSGHSKPKLGKAKRITRTESFLKRQREATRSVAEDVSLIADKSRR